MLMDPRIVRIVSVAILLVLGCLYVYAFVLNKPADEDRSFDPDPTAPPVISRLAALVSRAGKTARGCGRFPRPMWASEMATAVWR